ncbi:MAG: hypothetical protein IIU66_05390 [Clostridia bacterium]|nr:hypothetical protein [Clostridia bacterium]MBQ5597899.1 hypothetical protein [Clostridia bacterium]
MIKNDFPLQTAKMLIWSVAYRIMCLVVSVSLIALINNKIGLIVAQCFCLAIFLVLPYIRMYDYGSNDVNRINYGHIKRDELKGLKIGLIVMIPYAIFAFFLLLSHLGVIAPSFFSLYRVVNSPFFCLSQTLLPPTLTATEQNLFAVILSMATVVCEPIVYGMGYRFGLARIAFTTETGIYKGKKKV